MRFSTAVAALVVVHLFGSMPAAAREAYRKDLLEGITDATPAPELFLRAYEVFSHPRCSNCHPRDDQPWWDIETRRVHGMNVQRGREEPDGAYGLPGMECVTCHQQQNAALPGGPPGAKQPLLADQTPSQKPPRFPPGAPVWRLAPKTMGWGGMPPSEMCRAIIRQDIEHKGPLAHIIDDLDPLVAWGWDPGPGRESAPGTVMQFVQLLKWWNEARGDKCP